MISSKICLLALVALAAPVLSGTLDRRDVLYTCVNTVGNFQISRNKAEGNIHAAPLSAGKSGYPHQFSNSGGIKWSNARCNNLAAGHILLEFPVFPDGHLYNWNSKPKDNPGPARGIYTNPGKDFCGVVSHTTGNEGPLQLCT